MKIKNNINFAIIGAGKIACDFSRLLIKNEFPKHLIITYPKSQHERDRILLNKNDNYEYIIDYCSESGIELIQTSSVNKVELIQLLKKKKINHIISLNNRMIFKEEFLNNFSNTFNVHHGILPFERSGSPPSDKILNNISEIGVTLHKVDPGIDSGPIVLIKSTKNNGNKILGVDDLCNIHHKLSIQILKEFLKIIINNSIEINLQNENQSVTLPRMYSEIHGAIDWSWNAIEIERFIRAFGYPYPGAFTHYKRKKIIIFSSDVLDTKLNYHPYYFGKIVGNYDGKYMRVIAKEGILVIKKVSYNDVTYNAAELLSTGETLYTPIEILEKAKTTRVVPKNMEPPPVPNS